jgi:3-deoxy-7-phosphoheptulonate synthase
MTDIELRRLPPLVFAGECDLLKERLARVARGEAFLLHGGLRVPQNGRDTADAVRDALRTVMQVSALLTYAAAVPVVKVSSIADGAGSPYTADRYHASAASLNLIRAFASGGYAGLRQVHAWNRDFVAHSPFRSGYAPLTAQLGRALDFMNACGSAPEDLAEVELFASHEAGPLEYETAMTRVDSRSGREYNTAGHLLLLGEGTDDLDATSVDYLADVRNPIGVVLGPRSGPDEALAALDRLDPAHEAGRLTFVVRMGAEAVRDALPAVVQKVTAQGHQVGWICDAMHSGRPAGRDGGRPAPRTFEDLLAEVTGFFEVHRELGTHAGGLHLKLAGRPNGGPGHAGLRRHHGPGPVDTASTAPCLAPEGALDLAFLLAGILRDGRR